MLSPYAARLITKFVAKALQDIIDSGNLETVDESEIVPDESWISFAQIEQ